MYKDVHLLIHIIIKVHIYVLKLTFIRVHVLVQILVHIFSLLIVKHSSEKNLPFSLLSVQVRLG
jgi:hypothetical protein